MGRKLFGTDGIRGKANKYPMTPDIILKLGQAITEVFSEKEPEKKHKFVIGKDTRLSGYMFESALEAGIVSRGGDVLLVGPLPTPAIAQLTKSMNADAGIVISASHNPSEDNGIKLFDSDGFKLDDNIEEEIEKIIFSKDDENEFSDIKLGKAERINEAQGRYIEFAKSSISSTTLEGLKIVLDCANGAAYSVAPKIFSELGAETIVINNKPDGYNINRLCGALHPEDAAMEVKKQQANIGITLDGDSDRIIVCDENGNVLSGDHIMGIIAEHMKKIGELKNNKVAITVMSNIGLKRFFDNKQIDYVETVVGDRYVIEKMKEDDIGLGGEQSGHIIMSDYTTTGDGIITGLQLAKIMQMTQKKLSELATEIKMYPQKLVNIDVDEKKPIEDLECYKKIKEIEDELGKEGRVLVRYSGTQNLCRIMVEAKNDEKAKEIADNIAGMVKKEIGKKAKEEKDE